MKEISRKDWPNEVKEAVENGSIRIGFTQDQVIAAWGTPENINRDAAPYGEDEWSYGDLRLRFKNGILQAYQEIR
jgi:hypothetical protein